MSLTAIFAADAGAKAVCTTDGSERCATGLPTVAADSASLHTILAVVFAVIGALCVLLVIVGALRLLEAQGNPDSVKKGRNTIVYALVGLVLALSAEVIVALVLGKL